MTCCVQDSDGQLQENDICVNAYMGGNWRGGAGGVSLLHPEKGVKTVG